MTRVKFGYLAVSAVLFRHFLCRSPTSFLLGALNQLQQILSSRFLFLSQSWLLDNYLLLRAQFGQHKTPNPSRRPLRQHHAQFEIKTWGWFRLKTIIRLSTETGHMFHLKERSKSDVVSKIFHFFKVPRNQNERGFKNPSPSKAPALRQPFIFITTLVCINLVLDYLIDMYVDKIS